MTDQEPQGVQPQPKQVSLDEYEEMVRKGKPGQREIPKSLWDGMRAQESGGDVGARSATGVKGRFQVTKATAAQYGYNRDDPFEQAAAAGTHLRKMFDASPGQDDSAKWWGAVAKYYGGDGAVDASGNLSDRSVDGISNPIRHINRVRQYVEQYHAQNLPTQEPQSAKADSSSQPPPSTAAWPTGDTPMLLPPVSEINKPAGVSPQARNQRAAQAAHAIAQINQAKQTAQSLFAQADQTQNIPAGQGVDDATALRQRAEYALERANELGRQHAKRFPDLIEVGFGNDTDPNGKMPNGQPRQWVYAKPKAGTDATYEQTRQQLSGAQSSRRQMESTQRQQQPINPLEGIDTANYTPEQRRALSELDRFAQRSAPGKAAEIVAHGLLQGAEGTGQTFGALSQNPVTTAYNLATTGKPAGNLISPAAQRTMSEQQAGQDAVLPNAAPIGRGITSAATQLPAYMLLPESKAAQMLAGGAMTATQQDWRDPGRAALNTGIGAVAGPLGATIGKGLASPVVNRLASPIARSVVEGAGQLAGGAAGNVIPTAAEELAYDGKLDPQKLAHSAVIGAAQAIPGLRGPGRIRQQMDQANVEQMAGQAQDRSGAGGTTITNLQGEGLPTPQQRLQQIAAQSTGAENAASLRYLPQSDGTMGLRVQKVAPTLGLAPQPEAPALPVASADFRSVADAAKIEAAQAERAGNYGAAAAQYDAARQTLVRLRRQSTKTADPQALADLDAEINLANQNKIQALNRNRANARQAAKIENAPTAEVQQLRAVRGQVAKPLQNIPNNIPEAGSLLRPEAQINSEGGVPKLPENSVNFARLAERQNARQTEAPAERGPANTEDLTVAGLIKRRLGGFRVSDRGEARVLGGREGNALVGLVSKDSPHGTEEVAHVLHEQGRTLDDGRPFVEDGRVVATESDVLDYVRAHGKEKVGGTNALNDRLAQEEADYYANRPPTEPLANELHNMQPESQSAEPAPYRTPEQQRIVDRRAAEREASLKGNFGKFGEAARKSNEGERTPLARHPELRELLDLPPIPDRETDAALHDAEMQHTLNALAELGGKPRSSELDYDTLRGVWRRLAVKAARRGAPISEDLKQSFKGTVNDLLESQDRFGKFVTNDAVRDSLNYLDDIYGEQREPTRREAAALKAGILAAAKQHGIAPTFAENWWRQAKAEAAIRAQPRDGRTTAEDQPRSDRADGERGLRQAGSGLAEAERATETLGRSAEVAPQPNAEPASQAPRAGLRGAESSAVQEEVKRVSHDNPAIDGKPIIATTKDGRVIIQNEVNQSGVSIVKDQSPESPDLTAHRARLMEKMKAYDEARNTTIQDVTPKGYGPEESTAESRSTRPSDYHQVAEEQRLRASIAEAKTILRGKMRPEKRAQIERSLQSTEDRLAAIVGDRKIPLGASEIEHDIPSARPPKNKTAYDEPTEQPAISPAPAKRGETQRGETAGTQKQLNAIAEMEAAGAITPEQAKRQRAQIEQQSNKPKLVTDAEARLAEYKSGKRSGSGAEALFDQAIVTGHKVYRAGMEFGEWAKEVVKEAGNAVRPHLRAAWKKLNDTGFSVGSVPEGKGQVLGSGGGGLQDAFGKKKTGTSEEYEPPAARAPFRPASIADLRAIGNPKLQQERAARSAAGMPQGQPQRTWSADHARQPKSVAQADEPASLLDKVSTIRKAAMLSRPTTHLRNIIGNTAFQIAEEATRIPGSAADIVMSVFTGKRSMQGASLSSESLNSTYQAAKEGISQAKRVMKGEKSEELGTLQDSKEVSFKNKWVDGAVKTIFRSLDAEDKFFFNVAKDRAMREQAKIAAINDVRSKLIPRSEVNARTAEYLRNPTEAMEAEALIGANVAVFRNKNKLSSAISSARQSLGGGGNFALDLVLPFDKTPTNIIFRAMEYSPIGGVKAAGKLASAGIRKVRGLGRNDVQSAMSEALTRQQQHEIAQLIGRTTVGTGIMALGYALASKGAMTGFYNEDDPRGEALKRASGAQPLSVRIGDYWVGLSGFAPLSLLLGMGATLHEETTKGQEANYVGASAKAAYEMTTELPLLRSLQDAGKSIDMIRKDSGNTGRAVGRIASSFIPGAVSDLGQIIPGVHDPYERETKLPYKQKVPPMKKASTEFTNEMMSKIPGARQLLPVKRDANGQPIETYYKDIIDPTKARPAVGALPRSGSSGRSGAKGKSSARDRFAP